MNILFLTVGDESVASTRARVYGYLPHLAKKGVRYKILKFSSPGKSRRVTNLKKDNLIHFFLEILHKIYVLTKLIIFASRFDVIFIQKVTLPRIILRILKRSNNRIIFDFDDAIQIYKDISYLLKEVSHVIVSNRHLADYALKFNNNVHELISPVSVDGKKKPQDRKRLTLGWIGSPEATRYLYPIIPVFAKLKEKFKNLDIEFMGASKNVNLVSSGIDIIDWSLEGQDGYLGRVDVGIMPLEDSQWARSKAGYKLLVYMSKGIACVASPVGRNTDIIEDGKTGFFAVSGEEWLERLSTLLGNAGLREEMAEKGRCRAQEHFSYDKRFPEFLNILYLAKECIT